MLNLHLISPWNENEILALLQRNQFSETKLKIEKTQKREEKM